VASEVNKLSVIGNNLVFIANALFALAANIVAKAEDIEDLSSKEAAESLASTFNIAGAWIQLLGDYIISKAVELQFQESLESGEPFDEELLRLTILATQAQVVLDVLFVQIAEKGNDVIE
jgi:hypothetical protein